MVTTLLQRGFTLVELVVTLVIIGALAAVSAPLFFGAQDFQQSAFYNETLSQIRYARKVAIASGCAVSVTVAGNGYTLSQAPAGAFNPMSPGTCNAPPYNAAVVDPAGSTYPRTATNVAVGSLPAAFVFCPRGDTSASGACTGNYVPQDVQITVGSQSFNIKGATGHVR